MFFTFKLKPFLLVAVIIICFVGMGFMVYFNVRPTSNYQVPNSKHTVVIDAGHGGIDGGSVGKFTPQSMKSFCVAFLKKRPPIQGRAALGRARRHEMSYNGLSFRAAKYVLLWASLLKKNGEDFLT